MFELPELYDLLRMIQNQEGTQKTYCIYQSHTKKSLVPKIELTVIQNSSKANNVVTGIIIDVIKHKVNIVTARAFLSPKS